MTVEVKPPGWVGKAVVIKAFRGDGDETIVGRVTLGPDGKARCDNAKLMSEWEHKGIVGRFDRGHLFPKDGQAFLDELPFMYKNVYMMAMPDAS